MAQALVLHVYYYDVIVLHCFYIQRNSGLEESDPVEAMKRLKSTQGALVPMPLDFLREEPDLLPEFGTIEYVAPNMLFK